MRFIFILICSSALLLPAFAQSDSSNDEDAAEPRGLPRSIEGVLETETRAERIEHQAERRVADIEPADEELPQPSIWTRFFEQLNIRQLDAVQGEPVDAEVVQETVPAIDADEPEQPMMIEGDIVPIDNMRPGMNIRMYTAARESTTRGKNVARAIQSAQRQVHDDNQQVFEHVSRIIEPSCGMIIGWADEPDDVEYWEVEYRMPGNDSYFATEIEPEFWPPRVAGNQCAWSWRIRALTDAGWGEWSGPGWHYNAHQPAWHYPGNSMYQEVVLDWQDVPGAAHYEVHFGTGTNRGFSFREVDTSSIEMRIHQVLGGDYTWLAYAFDSQGEPIRNHAGLTGPHGEIAWQDVMGSWSTSPRQFTVVREDFVPVSRPVNWQPINGASTYRVTLSVTEDFTVPTHLDEWGPVPLSNHGVLRVRTGLNEMSYQFNELPPNQQFWVLVEGLDDAGQVVGSHTPTFIPPNPRPYHD